MFAASFRREADSKDRYQQNRRVVEHKGLLRSFSVLPGYLSSFHSGSAAHESSPTCARSCTRCHAPRLRRRTDCEEPKRRPKPYAGEFGSTKCLSDASNAPAKDGGFSNPSAFIRAAIERELAGRESGVDAAEERIAASLDRLAREIRRVNLGQQALFAFVDSLVKTLLTCVAEPPRDAYDQAVARGRVRYDRFLKSVGAGMAGDSQAAMTELLKRGEEN